MRESWMPWGGRINKRRADNVKGAHHSSLSFRAASTSASSLTTDSRSESVLASFRSRSRFCSFRTSMLSFRCRS
jgi:hypothetical protein